MTREIKPERILTLRRTRLLLAVALLLTTAVPSFSRAGEQRAMRDTFSETKPWPAPTGHRQLHATDVPQELSDDDQLFAALDRKLRICRGC